MATKREETKTITAGAILASKLSLPALLVFSLCTVLIFLSLPAELQTAFKVGWMVVCSFALLIGLGLFFRWAWVKISAADIQGRTIHASKSALVKKDGSVEALPQGPAGYGANRLTSLTEHRHADSRQDAPALNPPIAEDITPKLPPVTQFDSVITTWKPKPDEILLALGPGGEKLTVAAQDLCHVAIAGITGGGKSVLMRLVISQLLYAGAMVVLADPHYTPFDAESGEDWRPIEKRLYLPPAVTMQQIAFVLDETVKEMDKRLAMRRAGKRTGPAFFLAIDELPVIAADLPDIAPQAIGRIVREGRKVGVLLITSAQDWLVKTIGADSGAVRNNFRTAFYVGGDQTTGRVLLDLPRGKEGSQLLEATPLGKGIAILRSKATPQATHVRVPLVTNESLYALLGQPKVTVTAPSQPQPDNSAGYTRPGTAHADPKPDNSDTIIINGKVRYLPPETKSEPNQVDNRQPKPRQPELDRALALWQQGYKSDRALAKALGETLYRANYLKKLLREQGLIE